MKKVLMILVLLFVVSSSVAYARPVYGMTRWLPVFFPAENVAGFTVGPGFGLKYAPTPGEIADDCIKSGLIAVEIDLGPQSSTSLKKAIRCYEGFPSKIYPPNHYEGHPAVTRIDWTPFSNTIAAGKLQTVYAYPYLHEFPSIIN